MKKLLAMLLALAITLPCAALLAPAAAKADGVYVIPGSDKRELTEAELIGEGTEPTLEATNLYTFGIGETQWGHFEVRVYPGAEAGRIEVTLKYDVAQ